MSDGDKFSPCPQCRRHVRRVGGGCPFCGTGNAVLAASMLALTLTACPKNDPVMAIYAGPPPELMEERGVPTEPDPAPAPAPDEADDAGEVPAPETTTGEPDADSGAEVDVPAPIYGMPSPQEVPPS